MRSPAYSLVEVVIAAAIVAIGVAAGAVMVNTIVVQEEINAGAVRAANMQEQATRLYRLGLTNPQDLYNILPEVCSASSIPPVGTFSLTFGARKTETNIVYLEGGSTTEISYETVPCTITYASAPVASGQVVYLSNTMTIVRPTLRIEP